MSRLDVKIGSENCLLLVASSLLTTAGLAAETKTTASEAKTLPLELSQALTSFDTGFSKIFPGGVAAYQNLFREKLSSKPVAFTNIEKPPTVTLEPGTSTYANFEQHGHRELGRCCFVLVAGGVGQRLGYSGIKLSLPFNTMTMTSYLEKYFRHLKTIWDFAKHDEPTTPAPALALLVSEETSDATRSLLQEHDYFGYPVDRVSFVKQQGGPAIKNVNGDVALDDDGNVVTLPMGHGDVHALLHSSGWAKDRLDEGAKWCMFFQDTNGLAFNVTAALLGVSKEQNLDMNVATVPRHVNEKAGVIVTADGPQGRRTSNIEYNVLEKDEAGPDGFSLFPGNTNNFVLAMGNYVNVLNSTGGVMPPMLNIKGINADGSLVKPTRLETLMQDVSFAYAPNKVAATMLPRWLSFSPLKDKTVEKGGIYCAFPVEMQGYECNEKLIKLAAESKNGTVELPPASEETFLGVTAKVPGTLINIDPEAFGVSLEDFKSKFADNCHVSLAPGSSLDLKTLTTGAIKDLNVEGHVEVRGSQVSRSSKAKKLTTCDLDASDSLKMRGFRVC